VTFIALLVTIIQLLIVWIMKRRWQYIISEQLHFDLIIFLNELNVIYDLACRTKQ
jgi:hypothetical protein